MPYFQYKTEIKNNIYHRIEKPTDTLPSQRKVPNKISDVIKIEKIGHQYI